MVKHPSDPARKNRETAMTANEQRICSSKYKCILVLFRGIEMRGITDNLQGNIEAGWRLHSERERKMGEVYKELENVLK